MKFLVANKTSVKFTEETPYDPRSPYAASKASSDHLETGMRLTGCLFLDRCSNNYGPYHFRKACASHYFERLSRKTVTHLWEWK